MAVNNHAFAVSRCFSLFLAVSRCFSLFLRCYWPLFFAVILLAQSQKGEDLRG
jgi:hypothetical protein